ncbi:hypothetical protein L6164_014248 [Bauhinia variegata]|uniref:Uncharacterized protein n=1 Tax=Bauhinia variegata TaxID=167791 RepID=A0ACB9NH84_BAUVA|nr:hypothetical protein L6164_014248 [Bauhinia variegata]
MVYSYIPTYYSTLHDSITSLCKTILPFSFKTPCLPAAAENKLSKLQSDNLKWQQDSFHQMLNLMGLHKEGILPENEVSAFRTHLLDTLIASPREQEHQVILRDKLLFLQELLFAKCISEEKYHSSKRPLLQRLAVQGAEIEARDVIVAVSRDPKENSVEEWSVIDLKDERCLFDNESSNSKNKSAMKQIKGAAVFSFMYSYKPDKNRVGKSISHSPHPHPTRNESGYSKENEWRSILMVPSGPPPEPMNQSGGPDNADKLKRKPFSTLFHREEREGHDGPESQETTGKSAKKQWGFDGFKRWKKNESDDEAYLASNQFSIRPLGEGPDTKLIKNKLHSDGSPSDFFIDKVLEERIKKELSRIQTELSSTNPSFKFSTEQIEVISTKLPVDKAELRNHFPKSWCDQYGDVVLYVVKKEFKDHVAEMENKRNNSRAKHSNSMRWTTFEDGENFQPNLCHQDTSIRSSNINPFAHSH